MLVRSLDELTAADLPEAGGKGANLGELRRANFPVPDGERVNPQFTGCIDRNA